MKEVEWKKSTDLGKAIIIAGWIPIAFFIPMLIIMWIKNCSRAYDEKYESERYDKFINPDSMKIVYIFGCIKLAPIILCLISLIIGIIGLIIGAI